MLMAVLTLVLSPAAAPPTTITSESPPQEAAWPASVSGDTLTATVFTSTGETLAIGIGNLDLHGRVPNVILRGPTTSDSARLQLLHGGYVSLVDESAATDAERTAQAEARNAGRGVWAGSTTATTAGPATTVPPSASGPEGPGWWTRASDWLQANWAYWLGGIGGVALIVGGTWRFVKQVRSRQFDHRHDVVVFGRPSAGKTSFIKTLQSRAPRLEDRPTTQRASYDLNSPILYGQHSFHLRMIDNAGMDSGRMLDDFNQGRKSVIVLMLAHTQLADEASEQEKSQFQQDYISQQLGYCSLVTSLIEAKTLRQRPELVVLFITKFDHLSALDPDDSSSKETLAQLLGAFAPHCAAVRTACESSGVPFRSIIGSSSKEWGFAKFDHEIQKIATR